MMPSSRSPITDSGSAQSDASPRELRAQMVQRLQVGLFGLSLMLLLVGLANIIMEHARRNDATLAQNAQASSSGTATGQSLGGQGAGDPLADIGVVPSPDGAGGKRATMARPSSGAGR